MMVSVPNRRTVLRGAGAAVALTLFSGGRGSAATLVQPDRGGDDTGTIQAALDADLSVEFTAGLFRISDTLRLRPGQAVTFAPGTEIRQMRFDRPAFVAERAESVALNLNGATIAGPGGYLRGAMWTGNQGNEGARGLRFLGCRTVRLNGPGRIVNWGNAAIDLTGGSDLICEALTITGTHGFGGRIAAFGNFQNGIYLSNDLRYGASEGVTIRGCDISGVAQGVLREAQPRAPVPRLPVLIDNCDFHDIPGQHGVYNQDGMLEVRNSRFRRLGGSAVKNQSADAGRMLRGIRASGIEAEDIGVALFELAEVGGFGGGLDDVILSGRARGAGYLAAVNGRVRNVQIDASGSDIVNHAAYVQGRGARSVSIRVDAERMGQDGVLVTARDCDVEIRARIRDANGQRRPGGSGIRVSSPDARVVLVDPDVADSRRRTSYALFSDTVGADVRVRGRTALRGARDAAVRATGRIAELPAAASLEGAIINTANVIRTR